MKRRRPGLPPPALATLSTLALFATACATPRTLCPIGTDLVRRIYSGGGEAEWCRRADGVRQGPETRYYESGVELATGEYLDGTVNGIWRYRFNNGRNWRADRWDDGALVSQTVDPAVARKSTRMLSVAPYARRLRMLSIMSVRDVEGV